MITEHDLAEAIAECQGQRNPSASTCIKLAAFYTIKRELFGEEKPVAQQAYSYTPAPDEKIISAEGDSRFQKLINGRPQYEIISVLDELMDTLNIIQPRLYNAVMDKLS